MKFLSVHFLPLKVTIMLLSLLQIELHSYGGWIWTPSVASLAYCKEPFSHPEGAGFSLTGDFGLFCFSQVCFLSCPAQTASSKLIWGQSPLIFLPKKWVCICLDLLKCWQIFFCAFLRGRRKILGRMEFKYRFLVQVQCIVKNTAFGNSIQQEKFSDRKQMMLFSEGQIK